MINYKYTAISKDGKKVSGIISAYNELDAADRIKQTCDIVVKLKEIQEAKQSILNMEIGGNKVKTKPFVMMCSQFSIILKSGIPISRAVKLIAQKTTDKKLKSILSRVSTDVEAGRSISASFEENAGGAFPQMFIETIRAGETSGKLSEAFASMYTHYDKQMKLRAKVRSALSYPAFVFVVAIVVVIVLMVKVIPTFTSIFAEYGSELPAITRLLVNMSSFFGHWWWLLLILAILCVIGYKSYQKTDEGRTKLGKLAFRLPVFGEINELNAASEFSNNLAMLISTGLPLTRCISITARVMSNPYLSAEVGKIGGKVEEGLSMSECVRKIEELPDILKDMVAVGETTGEMYSTMHTIGDYYNTELEQTIQKAMSKLEPALLVFLALFAGFIVIAIYMAMFEMYNVM